MAEGAEKLRRVRGGIGTIATKCITEFDAKNAAGDTALGIKVPAGCLVIAATVKNGKNDLAGDGASIGLKLGNVELIAPEGIASIKGKAIGGAFTAGYATEKEEEIKLEVAGAALTDGKLDVCVLYI